MNARHKWFFVEEDVRTSVLDPRPLLWRCQKCGIYKTNLKDKYSESVWRTYYGQPYSGQRWAPRAPECTPVKGEHQWRSA